MRYWKASLTKTIFSAVFAGLMPITALAAPHRLAVVIGNQDYARISDLGNAHADAERMADMLKKMGFSVFEGYNLDRRGFEEIIRQSILNAGDEAEVVFFYAGHGIQIGRRNYLLPVDVSFKSVYDLPVESVTLDRVIDVLSARGKVHVAIIDACRDNPFPDKLLAGNLDASLFETKSGFDVFQTPLNSLVAFSTSPGMLAFDGTEGTNSPYTSAILRTVQAEPDAEISNIFSRVRESVYSATNGQQVPWESSTLVQPFHFFRDTQDGNVVLAQADTSGDKGGSGTVERGSPEIIDLPDAVTLDVTYDRVIPLSAELARALSFSGTLEAKVTSLPSNGMVEVSSSGMNYQPRLTERRSDTRALTLSDEFAVTFESDDRESTISVTLEMPVNSCDLAAGDALDPGGVGFYRLPNEIEIEPALAACRDAAARYPDEPRFRYQLGRAEQAAGLFKEAFESFNVAMEAGHIRALDATARLLNSENIQRDVVDIPLDPARATELLERGVAAGDPFAIHSLGQDLLREGETVEARERGFDLLDRAAELGHTYSMNELGIYFLTKDSDHYVPERGIRYLQASAGRDDIYGYHNLGFVALYGLRDGTVDYQEAYVQFVKAAEGGHPHSPGTLGRMIIRGQVPGQVPQDALYWYDLGLTRGDGWSGVNGAYLILNGEVSGHSAAEGLIRAAKALHLPDDKAVAAARDLIADRSEKDMARAMQILLRDLGADIQVDGVVGPSTRRTLADIATAAGLAPPADDRFEQLSTAAKLFWAQNPTRPDLF